MPPPVPNARTLTGHTGYVVGCAVSPDGAWIVSAATDHALNIWDTAIDGQPNAATGHKERRLWLCGEPGWLLDRFLKLGPHAQNLGRRLRRRAEDTHWPRRRRGKVRCEPGRHLDSVGQP